MKLFAGVDLGGTKIAVVIADACGRTLAEGTMLTEAQSGPEQAVQRTCALLDDLCRSGSLDYRAIGIGMPGLVDAERGTIVFLPNLPRSWQGFDISAAFAEHKRRPVSLLNDARMGALGEFTCAHTSGVRDLLFVTVGTGIGGGLVLDGKLREGAFGAAGELGHQTILPDGPPCSCGSNGCLETLVSGPALASAGRALMDAGAAPRLRDLTLGRSARVTATLMAQAAREGDQAIGSAIQRAAEYLGVGIANAVTITAVSKVVIGGGLASIGDMLVEHVRRVVCQRVRMFPGESVDIQVSKLGGKSGCLGAAVLAAQHYGNRNNTEFTTNQQASA